MLNNANFAKQNLAVTVVSARWPLMRLQAHDAERDPAAQGDRAIIV